MTSCSQPGRCATVLCLLQLFQFLLTGCKPQAGSTNVNNAPTPRAPQETSFWVWNASGPLDGETLREIESGGVRKLYWQVTELIWKDGQFKPDQLRKIPADTASLHYIPVIRLSSTLTDPSLANGRELADWACRAGVRDAVQFDYDCPQRLLRNYATLLTDFRTHSGVAWLATTALGDWHAVADWPAVESTVDAVFPMLYDVEKELPPAESGPPNARSLADDGTVRLVERWSAVCRKPWYAGLPNFRRLSLFRENKLRGHIRSWSMDQILANPALAFHSFGGPGIQRIAVRQPIVMGETQLERGDWLVVRECAPDALARAITAVANSSSVGIVWYVLPRQRLASSGWSLPMLTNGLTSAPRATLSWQDGILVLRNDSTTDFGFWSAGHSLELQFSPTPPRELLAGEFHQSADGLFRFPNLPVGRQLSSGAVVFAPESALPQVRYRVDGGLWQSLEPR